MFLAMAAKILTPHFHVSAAAVLIPHLSEKKECRRRQHLVRRRRKLVYASMFTFVNL
jgi:hypothetical protein